MHDASLHVLHGPLVWRAPFVRGLHVVGQMLGDRDRKGVLFVARQAQELLVTAPGGWRPLGLGAMAKLHRGLTGYVRSEGAVDGWSGVDKLIIGCRVVA